MSIDWSIHKSSFIPRFQILIKIFSGLNTWNINDNHVDLESELAVITDCAPPGEEARGGKIKNKKQELFSVPYVKNSY